MRSLLVLVRCQKNIAQYSKHPRMFAWSLRKHGSSAHIYIYICFKLKLQLKGNRNRERTSPWSIEEKLKPMSKLGPPNTCSELKDVPGWLAFIDKGLQTYHKFYKKIKPPVISLRNSQNVFDGLSSQPDIPLLGKYVFSFAAAKDQTSKRLLQNELDLTTQKRQPPCSMFIDFSIPFHLSKRFLLETTKHQHSEILSVW